MKSLKSKHHKGRKWFVTLLVLLAAITCLTFAWLLSENKTTSNSSSRTGGINYNKASASQQEAGSQTKTNVQAKSGGSDQPPAPTAIQSSNQKEVGISITSAQATGSEYVVRAVINTVTGTGTCTLTMEKAGTSTVTMSAGTQPLASTSTCQGFTIPLSSLPSGTWDLTVRFSDNNLVGSITKQVLI